MMEEATKKELCNGVGQCDPGCKCLIQDIAVEHWGKCCLCVYLGDRAFSFKMK